MEPRVANWLLTEVVPTASRGRLPAWEYAPTFLVTTPWPSSESDHGTNVFAKGDIAVEDFFDRACRLLKMGSRSTTSVFQFGRPRRREFNCHRQLVGVFPITSVARFAPFPDRRVSGSAVTPPETSHVAPTSGVATTLTWASTVGPAGNGGQLPRYVLAPYFRVAAWPKAKGCAVVEITRRAWGWNDKGGSVTH
jgi:hypothetical protein